MVSLSNHGQWSRFGGQTNPLVLSLSKDEPWDARGSTGSPRAWEPISARSKLDDYQPLAPLDSRRRPPINDYNRSHLSLDADITSAAGRARSLLAGSRNASPPARTAGRHSR